MHRYRSDEIRILVGGGLDMLDGKGGLRPSARNCHVGGHSATNAADGTDSTPVITELYIGEIYVPATVLSSGVAIFSGSVWSDNFKVGIYDANGVLLGATATTAGNSTADTYQRAAWATGPLGAALSPATLLLPGPGTYYLGVCLDGTTSRLNTHTKGNFGAAKATGLVYATNFAVAGTALTITPPTTFTTALAPYATLY